MRWPVRRWPTGGEIPGWASNLRQLTLHLAVKTGWGETAIHGMPIGRLLGYIKLLTPEKP
jgi:hypothetical protein